MTEESQIESIRNIESREFIDRLKAWDREAFKILVQTFQDKIYNLGYRITRNPEEAEEVLQDTLLTIFNKIHTFEGRSRLSTWIYAITSNGALSRLRKKKEPTVTFDDEISLKNDSALFRNGSTFFQPDDIKDTLIEKELSDLLDNAICSLPDGYREIYVMKELHNIPVKEVAKIVGIKTGAAKTRLHRARLILRAKLSDYWEEDKK